MRLDRLFLAVVTLLVVIPTYAAALCMAPLEVTDAAPIEYRYAWFLIESLARARLAWEEADVAADTQHAVARLAGVKLAVEDFECAASLVRPFQEARGPEQFTTEAVQVSAGSATMAYTTFATGFQRWAAALARGEGLPLEQAADLKVENEKAGEFLINAAGAAWGALLKPKPDSTAPMDRLSVTRAQRAALRNGLKRRFPASGTHKTDADLKAFAAAQGTHTPDLTAEILYKGLSNPRYKAADEP